MSCASPWDALAAMAAALPEHMALAADDCRQVSGLPDLQDIKTIAILGMGSARTAGRAIRAVGANVSQVPILVVSSYEIPACIGPGSLVFAVSGSGNTHEVNHAAASALQRGAKLIAIARPGWLVDLAGHSRTIVVPLPAGIQPARATFGAVVASILTILGRIGCLPDADDWVQDAILQLKQRRELLLRSDAASALIARGLVGRHASIQGDHPIGSVAAERWKSQINQNAQQPASSSEQPNASHAEAVAWDAPPVSVGSREAIVLLRHRFEDSRVSRRMDLLVEHLADRVPVHSICGNGNSRLAVLMDLVMIGDSVSLHMAAANGCDPAATSFISETLKQGLLPPSFPRAVLA